MPESRVGSAAQLRAAWNRASTVYRSDRTTRDAFGHDAEEYRAWLSGVFESVPAGADVLDLGCGNGIPASAMLAKRFRVTGVDISDVQIERARRNVPTATFLRADMTQVRFPSETFRAVVCFYALIHVRLRAQRPLLGRIHRWLAPGGWLVLVTGHSAFEGTEADWLGSGATMFWSHEDAGTYRGWLASAGFRIREQRFLPEGDGGHELFVVQRHDPPAPRRASQPRLDAGSDRSVPDPSRAVIRPTESRPARR